jgi:hypothetical protein
MSQKRIPAYADARGVNVCGFGGVGFGQICEGSGAPTNSVSGYQTGAIWSRRDGGVDTAFYINVGNETSSTWVPIATSSLNGLLATAAELNRVAQLSTREVAAGGANLTVTLAAHDGRTILLDQATGTAVTLPAMTGSGAKYRFVCTVSTSGGSQVITATGAHLFGGVFMNTDTAAGTLFTAVAAANAGGSTVITLDGSTKGGRKGDWIEIEDVATNIGIVRGSLNGSGTEATPFS